MQYAYDKLSINKRNQNSQKGPKTLLVAQLYPTLCDPWTVASVHGILQARLLEWVVISFSRRSS